LSYLCNPEGGLAAIAAIESKSWCGNAISTAELLLQRLVSGIHQGVGRYAEALVAHELAYDAADWSLNFPDEDLFFARRAYLLGHCGRGQEATTAYQRLVDLYPKTHGAALAEAQLQLAGRCVVPTAARLKTTYLDPKPERPPIDSMSADRFVQMRVEAREVRDEIRAIEALAVHRFPESYDTLEELWLNVTERRQIDLIRAFGRLGDQRALPRLQGIISSPAPTHLNDAMRALVALGDRTMVSDYLDHIRKGPTAGRWQHEVLVEAYGGGPKLPATRLFSSRRFVKLWRKWIADHAAREVLGGDDLNGPPP